MGAPVVTKSENSKVISYNRWLSLRHRETHYCRLERQGPNWRYTTCKLKTKNYESYGHGFELHRHCTNSHTRNSRDFQLTALPHISDERTSPGNGVGLRPPPFVYPGVLYIWGVGYPLRWWYAPPRPFGQILLVLYSGNDFKGFRFFFNFSSVRKITNDTPCTIGKLEWSLKCLFTGVWNII